LLRRLTKEFARLRAPGITELSTASRSRHDYCASLPRHAS